MRIMLISFIVVALLMGAWIIFGAPLELSIVWRVALAAIALVVSVVITWLAWSDSSPKRGADAEKKD